MTAPRQRLQQASWGFMLKHPAHVLALGFGAGLSPKAPGTVGTLLAWALWTPILWAWSQLFFLHSDSSKSFSLGLATFLLLIGFAIGVWACMCCAQHLGIADPGSIVWDEIIAFWGILAALQAVGMTDWLTQTLAFAAFRLFDAVKHGPVAWADRAFKGFGWQGGFGIMLDDVIAALLALATLWIGFTLVG